MADLTSDTTYYFWLVDKESNVVSNMARAATPAATPGAPARLTATPGNAQVTLSWAAPLTDGGLPIRGYNVYAGTAADFNGSAPVATVAGTSYTVPGLVNGTTYCFWVTAVNRVGEGLAAEAKAVPVTVPGAPAGLTATAGNGQATLSWAAPASDGGSPVSGYIIYQGTSRGGETGPPVNDSLVTATRFTVTGLVNGTTYYFKVIAVNAVGQSPPSGEASATLPPASTPPTSTPPASTPPASTPPTTPAPSGSSSSGAATAFAAPTGLTATAGNTQVRLSWTAPVPDGGSPVTSYKIYLATAAGLRDSTAVGRATGTAATVTGLVNGTTYYFMVAAINAAGTESPFSTAASAEPTEGVPLSLTSPAVPKQLIALLAAAAAAAAAGGFTLITRRRRRRRSPQHARSQHSQPRSRQVAAASDVRAVPDTSRPDVMSVRDTGREATHTVRLEPHPGVATTTIKERRP